MAWTGEGGPGQQNSYQDPSANSDDGASSKPSSLTTATEPVVPSVPAWKQTEQKIADFTRKDYEARSAMLADRETELKKLASSTHLIDDAMERSLKIGSIGQERQDRLLGGYGVNLGGAAKLANRNALGMATALGTTQNVADARLAQQELKMTALGDLVAVGRRRQQSALQGLGDYTELEYQSQVAYNNAQRNYQQSRNNMMSGLLGIGGYALGGPVGGMIGGTLGSSLG